MFTMNRAGLQGMLECLQQAKRDHLQWYENVVRSIVCRLPCDPADLASDAHERCRFGAWCRSQAPAELRAQSIFAAIVVEHVRLHRIAAGVLGTAVGGSPIGRDDFDALASAGARLVLGIESLQHEIEGTLRDSDPLTGAYGRGQLLPELAEWRELARRGLQVACIAFMDLDRLKLINDTHGHVVGDRVLAGAVARVREHIRPYDKLFRYGGDEFILLLPGISLDDAMHLVERIRCEFGRRPLAISADGSAVHATASFGLASLDPERSVEVSIECADQALLCAKSSGRDRVARADDSRTSAASEPEAGSESATAFR